MIYTNTNYVHAALSGRCIEWQQATVLNIFNNTIMIVNNLNQTALTQLQIIIICDEKLGITNPTNDLSVSRIYMVVFVMTVKHNNNQVRSTDGEDSD